MYNYSVGYVWDWGIFDSEIWGEFRRNVNFMEWRFVNFWC